MKPSIVIPAYNSAATLKACLTACVAQCADVIVVDDGSTDATPKITREFPVTLLSQKNKGPATARNAGARAAKGTVIFFTDADCVPESEWVARLLELMERTNAGAVGGGYSYHGTSKLGQWIHEEISIRHSRMRGTVNFLGSFNLAVQRKAFQRVHGFDESFRRPSAEDNDFCYRLKKTGCRMVFDSSIKVEHLHPWGLRRYLRIQARHGFWRAKLYLAHPEMRPGDHYAQGAGFFFPPKGTPMVPRYYLLVFFRLFVRLSGFLAGFFFWRVWRKRR